MIDQAFNWATLITVLTAVGLGAYKFGKLEQKVADIGDRVKGIANMIAYHNPDGKEDEP